VAGEVGGVGVAGGWCPAEVAVAGTVRTGLVATTGLVRTFAVLSGRATADPAEQPEITVSSANAMTAAAPPTGLGRHRIPLSWLLTTGESTRPTRP
jgi:hypothetical protein